MRQYAITTYVKNTANVRVIESAGYETAADGRNAVDAVVGTPRTIGFIVPGKFDKCRIKEQGDVGARGF